MAQHSTVCQLIAEGAKTSSPITIFCLHGCQTIKEVRGADGLTDHSIHRHRKSLLFFFFSFLNTLYWKVSRSKFGFHIPCSVFDGCS